MVRQQVFDAPLAGKIFEQFDSNAVVDAIAK